MVPGEAVVSLSAPTEPTQMFSVGISGRGSIALRRFFWGICGPKIKNPYAMSCPLYFKYTISFKINAVMFWMIFPSGLQISARRGQDFSRKTN